jgi:methylthioribose-1-phosphate isomerase
VSGELVYLYSAMQNLGKEISFIASETRPYLQGTRLTFWELNRLNIPVKLICDNQVAWLMHKELVNCVVVGSDRSTIQGDIINKIGTYSLACLANYCNIPFYVLTQFPMDISGENIPIEERNYMEVFQYIKKDEYPPTLYPSFDLTKSNLISGWFDFSGEVKLNEDRRNR